MDGGKRVALVTGAARGLGFEMARGLARVGHHVVIGGRNEEALGVAAQALHREGASASVSVFDVDDWASVDRAVAVIGERHGGIDVLVNNAALRDRRSLQAFARADLDRMFGANVYGPLHLGRRAAAGMAVKGWGRIINVTSVAGPLSRSGDALYTATKGALASLTRAMAMEFGEAGITVNAIAPGFFATEANEDLRNDPEVTQFLGMRTALKRWGRPGEIAGAAVFLASEEASYITGQVITVDGGLSARM